MQVEREQDTRGAFVRQDSAFRDTVIAPDPGRYHLYASLACPWAHRAIIVRRLKGLEDALAMTVVDPVRDERGWRFTQSEPDPVNGWDYLAEGYAASDPAWEGRVTVPVLWDKQEGRIVNNESADVIVALNHVFDAHAAHPEVDLYPEHLRGAIDELNAFVYERVNNGVYRAGFASNQEAYEAAAWPLFEALATLDERLSGRRFLMGSPEPTLADWRLFTTLVRFDAVYHGHFKCNLRRIADHAHLSGYLRDLYQWPGVGETVDFDEIKRHYYGTHPSINPTGVVPIGPEQDLGAPHDRAAL